LPSLVPIFFDSEDRAERKHAKRKNATITKFGTPCKGIKPIRPSVKRQSLQSMYRHLLLLVPKTVFESHII
jgi:hypothetical protein